MTFDFSLLAQLERNVHPLNANMGEKRVGPSEDTVKRVLRALSTETPRLSADVAKKVERSQSNTAWCLQILKARGLATHSKKLGPNGSKRWVRT